MGDFLFYEAIQGGGYEPEVVRIIGEIVKPGHVCVDVGANRGFLTLVMARLAGHQGTVHAVEPNPDTCRRLEANIVRNRRDHPGMATIIVHPFAALDSDGSAELFSSRVDAGRDSLQPFETPNGRHVPTRSLDGLLRSESAIDFVKIDVEGAELSVIRGMHSIIKRSDRMKMILEWNRVYATHALWEEVTAHFDVFRISQGRDRRPVGQVLSPHELRGIVNLLCVRRPQ